MEGILGHYTITAKNFEIRSTFAEVMGKQVPGRFLYESRCIMIFTARRYAQARSLLSPGVRPSVCLSVCLSR